MALLNKLVTRKTAFAGTLLALALNCTPLNNISNYSFQANTQVVIAQEQKQEKQEEGKEEKHAEKQIKYTKIVERTVTRAGYQTVKAEFGLESKLWESLPKGLTKQEFYDKIKNAPMQSTTTTLLEGVPFIHPGPINSEDLLAEFMYGSDYFIKKGVPELDSDLNFSEEDKTILKQILGRELKSNMEGKVSSLNPFAEARDAYLFPPQSRIYLKACNGDPSIIIETNTGTKDSPKYETRKSEITDSKEKEVFYKFFILTVLSPDKDKPEIIPINNLYKAYLKRE